MMRFFTRKERAEIESGLKERAPVIAQNLRSLNLERVLQEVDQDEIGKRRAHNAAASVIRKFGYAAWTAVGAGALAVIMGLTSLRGEEPTATPTNTPIVTPTIEQKVQETYTQKPIYKSFYIVAQIDGQWRPVDGITDKATEYMAVANLDGDGDLSKNYKMPVDKDAVVILEQAIQTAIQNDYENNRTDYNNSYFPAHIRDILQAMPAKSYDGEAKIEITKQDALATLTQAQKGYNAITGKELRFD